MKCFGSTSVLFLGSMGHCTVWTSSAAYSSTSINGRLISTCADCLIIELGMNVKRIWETRYVLRKASSEKGISIIFSSNLPKKRYNILHLVWGMSGADGFIQMAWKHSAQNLDKNTCGGKKLPWGTQMIIKKLFCKSSLRELHVFFN